MRRYRVYAALGAFLVYIFLYAVVDKYAPPRIATTGIQTEHDALPKVAKEKQNEAETYSSYIIAGSNEPKPDPYTKKMKEMWYSLEEYVKKFSSTHSLIVQNGLLYDATISKYVTPELLVEMEYLPSAYYIKNAQNIYVSPEKINELIPLFDGSENPLNFYVTLPSDSSYLMMGSSNTLGRITAKQYTEFMQEYYISHGTIRRITASSPEYLQISNAINDYLSTQSSFFIRYAMRNDKYAIVVASPKSNYTNIKQYLIVFEADSCNVIMNNLENVSSLGGFITNKVFDFDIALLPKYELINYKSKMYKDMSAITDILIINGYISPDSGDITFISGTSGFAYVTYSDGQKFAAVAPDSIWKVVAVDNAEVAKQIFDNYSTQAPDFVLSWE